MCGQRVQAVLHAGPRSHVAAPCTYNVPAEAESHHFPLVAGSEQQQLEAYSAWAREAGFGRRTAPAAAPRTDMLSRVAYWPGRACKSL